MPDAAFIFTEKSHALFAKIHIHEARKCARKIFHEFFHFPPSFAPLLVTQSVAVNFVGVVVVVVFFSNLLTDS